MVDMGLTVVGVDAGSNGAYVHDRRSGARIEVAAMPAHSLSRHNVDDLYGATLVEALSADITVLTGPEDGADVLSADTVPPPHRRHPSQRRAGHRRPLGRTAAGGRRRRRRRAEGQRGGARA